MPYRDAKTGEYVDEEYAKQNPDTTVFEEPGRPDADMEPEADEPDPAFGETDDESGEHPEPGEGDADPDGELEEKGQ